MKTEVVYKKVLVRRDGVKLVIIPKESSMASGDYVKITKLEEKDGRREREKRR